MRSTRLSILCPFAASLLLATVAAQGDAAPNRFVPEDAQVVLRFAAPTKWAAQFANTKIARVLGGEALAPMMEQFGAGLDEGLSEMKRDGVDPDLLDGFFDKYTGEIVIALRLDLEDLPAAMEEGRAPALAVSLALSPDGSYDLPGFAASMTKALEEKHSGDVRDMDLGDHTLRVRVDADAQISLPAMIDDHLVMVFSTDMERDGAKMLASDDRAELAGAGKSMYLHVTAGPALAMLFDVLATKMAEDPSAPPVDLMQAITDLGFTCLEGMDLSIGSDGDQAVLETSIATKPDNHGIFGLMLVDQGAPRLLRYLPPSATTFNCQAFDIGAFYRSIGKVWSAFDEIAPIAFGDVEAIFEEATKVRLEEDLIDHIGTELLSVADFAAEQDLDAEDPFAFLHGTCYALSLKDGKAFGTSLETALRSRGLHAARKTEEYQGVKVYRLRVGGLLEIEYAITDDLLLLALGGDEVARSQLRSILDARANPTSGIPESIAKLADKVPPGWNGVGVTPMATMLQTMGTMMQKSAPPDMPPEVAMMLSLIGTIGAEMKHVGLDDAVGFSWSSPSGIRSIVRL